MTDNRILVPPTLVIIMGEAVKVIMGIRAKGSCKDMRTLSPSLRDVKSSMPLNTGWVSENTVYQVVDAIKYQTDIRQASYSRSPTLLNTTDEAVIAEGLKSPAPPSTAHKVYWSSIQSGG